MKKYSIFISSSDSYSDIWPVFFDLFAKYWPEFDGNIYLNTENLDYSHEKLKIKCTKVGNIGKFGKVFRAGLDLVETDSILLIMIDYIFMDFVNHKKIEEYYDFFCTEQLDSLCLEFQGYPNMKHTNNPELSYVLPPAPHIMFSYQIAFWNKRILKEMALPHEDPWMSEWFGSQRAEKIKLKLACPNNGINWPIKYDLRGCLHQGKWLDNAVSFLNDINYKVDFDKRGYYKDGYKTFIFRIKIKYKIWKTGLIGSYWDLMLR